MYSGLLYVVIGYLAFQGGTAWNPRVGEIIAFRALCKGYGPLSYVLLECRYVGQTEVSVLGDGREEPPNDHSRATWQ